MARGWRWPMASDGSGGGGGGGGGSSGVAVGAPSGE